jgi:hypothetical protein
LPQYFRHNRFQSLVRQLNFYSFRKINRERNVWIYKHNLFHRDHPENLYLVRRRTCPGLDGRKQRFSTRKVGKKDGNSDDELSGDDASIDETYSVEASTKKRGAAQDQHETDKPKKARTSLAPETAQEPVSPVVDTSIISSVVEANINRSVIQQESDDEADDGSLNNKRNDKLEMLEQSLVVSDVAMKLEEYAKRAMKDRGVTGRTRRGGAGVVTPPFGSSYHANMSAGGLITYDDEIEEEQEEDLRVTDLFGIHSASSVVTDTDSEADGEPFESRLPKELLVAPVNMLHAKAITEHLLPVDITAAAVAGFCMTTAPNGDPDMCRKILNLIASCEKLASEFHQYRTALKPLTDFPATVTPIQHVRQTNLVIWEREGSRHDAVRDFKTFSVNCVHKILGKNGWCGGVSGLAQADRLALEHTAEVWLKSVGTTDYLRIPAQ